MPIYLPTLEIPDRRVVAAIFDMLNKEAKKQGFSASAFPVRGDLSLGELVSSINKWTPDGQEEYKNALNFLLGFAPELPHPHGNLVSRTEIDQRVIDSYLRWLTDMAHDRFVDSLHQEAMVETYKTDPENSDRWREVDFLSCKKWTKGLSKEELEKLKKLEAKLDPKTYAKARKKATERMLAEYRLRVFSEYKVPGMQINFSEAFEELSTSQDVSKRALEIYLNLVTAHVSFDFRE